MHTAAMPQSYHFEGINASHDLFMASLNQAQGSQQLQNSGHGSEDKRSMHAYIARRSSASEGSQPSLGLFRAHSWILHQLHIPKWSKTDTPQQTN